MECFVLLTCQVTASLTHADVLPAGGWVTFITYPYSVPCHNFLIALRATLPIRDGGGGRSASRGCLRRLLPAT